MADELTAAFRDALGGNGPHTLPLLHGAAGATLQVILLDTGTVAWDASTLQDEADLTSGIVDQGDLDTPTWGVTATGALDFSPTTLSAVSGASVEKLVIADSDTGAAATELLIAGFDVSLTPTGGDVTVIAPAGGILEIGGS